MHGMVARISPRNRMPGSRTLKFESQKKCSVCSIPLQSTDYFTAPTDDRFDSRMIDLSCTEKGACSRESGTSKPHGMSACSKLRQGRTQHAGSQDRSHIHSTSIIHPQASLTPQSHKPHSTIAQKAGMATGKVQA
jgi:hypothetical protein